MERGWTFRKLFIFLVSTERLSDAFRPNGGSTQKKNHSYFTKRLFLQIFSPLKMLLFEIHLPARQRKRRAFDDAFCEILCEMHFSGQWWSLVGSFTLKQSSRFVLHEKKRLPKSFLDVPLFCRSALRHFISHWLEWKIWKNRETFPFFLWLDPTNALPLHCRCVFVRSFWGEVLLIWGLAEHFRLYDATNLLGVFSLRVWFTLLVILAKFFDWKFWRKRNELFSKNRCSVPSSPVLRSGRGILGAQMIDHDVRRDVLSNKKK